MGEGKNRKLNRFGQPDFEPFTDANGIVDTGTKKKPATLGIGDSVRQITEPKGRKKANVATKVPGLFSGITGLPTREQMLTIPSSPYTPKTIIAENMARTGQGDALAKDVPSNAVDRQSISDVKSEAGLKKSFVPAVYMPNLLLPEEAANYYTRTQLGAGPPTPTLPSLFTLGVPGMEKTLQAGVPPNVTAVTPASPKVKQSVIVTNVDKTKASVNAPITAVKLSATDNVASPGLQDTQNESINALIDKVMKDADVPEIDKKSAFFRALGVAGLSLMATPTTSVPESGSAPYGRAGLAGLAEYDRQISNQTAAQKASMEENRLRQALGLQAIGVGLQGQTLGLHRDNLALDRDKFNAEASGRNASVALTRAQTARLIYDASEEGRSADEKVAIRKELDDFYAKIYNEVYDSNKLSPDAEIIASNAANAAVRDRVSQKIGGEWKPGVATVPAKKHLFGLFGETQAVPGKRGGFNMPESLKEGQVYPLSDGQKVKVINGKIVVQ